LRKQVRRFGALFCAARGPLNSPRPSPNPTRNSAAEGFADYEAKELDLAGIPETRTQVMLNLANPAAAFRWWRIPADGVGLARMEFVVAITSRFIRWRSFVTAR
jgi:hypothetical protein